MDNKNFNYKYSAPSKNERREITGIRKQYLPKEKEDKLTRLRNLDRKVKNTAMSLSLCAGVIGTLIFGLGLTMVLEWELLVFGIIVSIVGAIPMGAAYYIYAKILSINKKKYGDEIIALSDELLNEYDEK